MMNAEMGKGAEDAGGCREKLPKEEMPNLVARSLKKFKMILEMVHYN